MLTIATVKTVAINVLSGVLINLLTKMGKGINDPVTIAQASMRAQAEAVIARCKRETPANRNMMFVKFTLPKDVSEVTGMNLCEEAMKNIMANVPPEKYQFIRFGYERRGVVIKMRHKPRGCAWINLGKDNE